MKKMKKFISMVLALTMVFSMAACSKTPEKTEDPGSAETETKTPESTETETEKPEKEKEKIKLRLVSISTDAIQTAILEDYIKKNIGEEFPNFEVEFEPGGGGEDMQNKLKTYNATGDLPDVWYSDSVMAFPIIKSGNQLNLKEHITADGFLNEYAVPEALEFMDGGIYTVPSGADTYFTPRIFFNKQIFADNNLEIPTTYEELLKVVEVLKAADIVPISLMGKGGWAPQLYLVQTFIQLLDPTVAEQILKNETDFSDPVVLEAVKKIEELAKAGAFPEGVANLDYGPSLEMFTSGRAAMFWGFSWEVPNLAADENIGMMQWPALCEEVDPATLTQVWGSPLNGYAVNANSEHLEEAIQLAEFCVRMEAQYHAEHGSATNLNPGIEGPEPTALMKQNLEMYEGAEQKINSIFLNAMDGSVGAEFGLLGANLLTGTYSAEDFVNDFNTVWAENTYFD